MFFAAKGENGNEDAKKWCKTGSRNGEYPFVRLYWKDKTDKHLYRSDLS